MGWIGGGELMASIHISASKWRARITLLIYALGELTQKYIGRFSAVLFLNLAIGVVLQNL